MVYVKVPEGIKRITFEGAAVRSASPSHEPNTGRTERSLFYCMAQERYRPDRDGTHRAQFDKNKKRIYATQNTCAICGQPVDFSIKWPHPMSPTIDHIVPVIKGGHPSDIDNLQLAHFACNRRKSDKLKGTETGHQSPGGSTLITNRDLPISFNWSSKPVRALQK